MATRARPFLLSLLAGLLVACGGPEPGAAASASPISPAAVEPGNAGGNRQVTVMSWNLYLGTDLGDVFEAAASGDEATLLAATTAAWQMVVRNDFGVRAAAVADRIAEARPELVGLQEAYVWRLGPTPAAMEVVQDYVAILLDELAARGLRYRVAAAVSLSDLTAPVLTSVSPPVLAYVRGTDREVILAREDVRTAGGEGHVFPLDHLLPIDVPGQEPFVRRGWASVDVKHQGVWFRLVSTHLEAYHPYFRALQAADLAAALASETGPVVLVGDLNSDPLDPTSVDGVPNALAYLTLAGAGFGDAWLALATGLPGLTSPFPEDLTDPALSLEDRIDFVLFRGALTPLAIAVVGTDAEQDRVCGVNLAGAEVCLWASDHAGLWATLRLEDPRFLALR